MEEENVKNKEPASCSTNDQNVNIIKNSNNNNSDEEIFEDATDDIIKNELLEKQSKLSLNDFDYDLDDNNNNNNNNNNGKKIEDNLEILNDDEVIDEEFLKENEKTLSPEEIQSNKEKSIELKNLGNEQYKLEQYIESTITYTNGLKMCPIQCNNERAILYGNRAAAYIQLNFKQKAIDDCTKSLEFNSKYMKALIRRAKLYEEFDKLDECLDDYKQILEIDSSNKDARQAIVRLPPLIAERNEKLKTEMLGKLKDLGNMILKPFGLSTNNFQMQQDPNSGSYSINFNQNAKQ